MKSFQFIWNQTYSCMLRIYDAIKTTTYLEMTWILVSTSANLRVKLDDYVSEWYIINNWWIYDAFISFLFKYKIRVG